MADKKDTTIIVNAEQKVWNEKEIKFEQVVALAFSPVPPNAFFTVSYERAEGNKEGTLRPGQNVKVKEGMIFNVTETGQS
jgi:hypothetical protein